MDLLAELKRKTMTAEAVAATVRDGDQVDYGMCLNQPDLFDKALAARKDELKDIDIRGTLSVQKRQVVEVDPQQEVFTYGNWHFGGYDRAMKDNGVMDYIPMNFGEAPGIYRRFLTTDLVVIKTTPMDAHGFFNYGATNSFIRASMDTAKRIVVETSTAIPRCFGIENAVHISEVEVVIEGDNAPLFELPNPPITEVDETIAGYIVEQLEDNSCLQLGIGGMPNAVGSAIARSDLKGLGIHTELFVDGMVDLVEAGMVTGNHKQSYRGQICFSFALGTQKTYDFLHDNEMCTSLPVNETNLPDNIARNKKVASINNALQIDLVGQVASESSGYRHITGTGGQLQFVRGAYASEGGKSFMCLSSRYLKGGEPKSRIVVGHEPGTIVTTPRTDTMYVVTEYGVTNLKGKNQSERALSLIELAHPDDREGLMKAARDNKVVSRRYW
ncbi:MAG: 4-hydroxybutyrate CoA-transferase [Gammaproteobacteria bacterium]|nr:4-hydroxybutyrate CoA-transferase [Gammaproteobacteria bacterium]